MAIHRLHIDLNAQCRIYLACVIEEGTWAREKAFSPAH